MSDKPANHLARASGCPLSGNKNSITAGPQGPTLLQDVHLIEKLQNFDREQLPPRNVHALGSGVYGQFTCTNDMTKYCMADMFSKVGKRTNLFARFSGTFTKQGDAETLRDIRGFALKFYSTEGNWDLMCINLPVFNCRDAMIGPEAIHSFKRDPKTDEWNPENSWKFVVEHKEALHQALMLYSDREGIPLSYRMMHAYGCNTYSFFNKQGERFWVKFHLRSEQEVRGFNAQDAKLMGGYDPDWLKRDLRESIQSCKYPHWKLCVQIMPEAEGYKLPEAFDCTKVWKHSDFPLIEVGRIELNSASTDYMAEVEQVAFSPANIIPGIGFSPDKLLQGRVFLYGDTQFHRLGPNYWQIPINRPLNELSNQYYGGPHQQNVKDTIAINYLLPNPAVQEPAISTDGKGSPYDYKSAGSDWDYFGQVRDFYRHVLKDKNKLDLAANIAESLNKISQETREQVVALLSKVSEDLAREVLSRLQTKQKQVETPNEKLWHELRANLHPEITSA